MKYRDLIDRFLLVAENYPRFVAHPVADWLASESKDHDAIAEELGITRDQYDLIRASRTPKTRWECETIASQCEDPERRATVANWIATVCGIPDAG